MLTYGAVENERSDPPHRSKTDLMAQPVAGVGAGVGAGVDPGARVVVGGAGQLVRTEDDPDEIHPDAIVP